MDLRKVLMIDHPACDKVDIAGGKGSMIHKMRKRFPELFPNAFIIPFDTELTEELLPEIEKCIQALGAKKYAVRSSALMEDMSQYSFAGQYLSVLNVSETEEILSASIKVRDSVNSSLVQSYIKTRDIEVDKLKMSVLIMPMVGDEENTISGVIFTSDTESGLPDIYITATKGLGDKEVSGLVTPEIAVMKEMNTGMFEVFRRKPRQGYDHKLFLLDNDILQVIARSAKQVEHYMKELSPEVCFADIEYCIQNGRLKYVQARPDTTLKNILNVQMVAGHEKELILRAGTSASGGIASGMLIYCKNIEDAEMMETGAVLMCDNTTSIWEPHMRRVKAIISRFGSSNCHTAIVARELGIPCIVGISASKHGDSGILEIHAGKNVTVDATNCSVYEGYIPEKDYVSAQVEPDYTGLDDEDFDHAFNSATGAKQTYTDTDGSKWIGKPNEATSSILNRIYHKSHDFISDRFGWPRITGRVRENIFEASMVDMHNWRVRLREFSPEKNSMILDEWQNSMTSFLSCSENFSDSDLERWIDCFVRVNGYMSLAFPLYMCVSGQFEDALQQRKIREPYFSRIHHCVNPNTPLSWAQHSTLDYIALLNTSESDEKIKEYSMRYRISPRFSQNFEDTPPFDMLKENIRRDKKQGVKPVFHQPFEEMYYPNDMGFQLIFDNRVRAIHLKESSHHQKFYGQWLMLQRIKDKQLLKNLQIG